MKHEDIAVLLKKIADPNTIDCLYRATQLELDYLNYDDTYQLARKCIKAISAMETDDAIKKLKLLTHSSTPEIAACAQKELDQMEL